MVPLAPHQPQPPHHTDTNALLRRRRLAWYLASYYARRTSSIRITKLISNLIHATWKLLVHVNYLSNLVVNLSSKNLRWHDVVYRAFGRDDLYNCCLILICLLFEQMNNLAMEWNYKGVNFTEKWRNNIEYNWINVYLLYFWQFKHI